MEFPYKISRLFFRGNPIVYGTETAILQNCCWSLWVLRWSFNLCNLVVFVAARGRHYRMSNVVMRSILEFIVQPRRHIF